MRRVDDDRRPRAVVTGASRGIGAAAAQALAAAGWDLVLGYRNDEEAAQRVARSCREAGAAIAQPIAADLGDQESVEGFWDAVDGVFGGRLDGLVNNAGIVSPTADVEAMTAERIRRVLDVNVTGAFLMAGAAVRRMSTAHGGDGGVIVNISSRAALRGGAHEYVDYAASKAALDALTTGLAQEVAASGIRVTGIRPGLIDTDIHAPGRLPPLVSSVPLRRIGTADEVAAAVVWLMSDGASYVTGATLDVSGGR